MKFSRLSISFILSVLFSSILFYACKKYKFNEITLTPELGIHLFKANISASELLNSRKDSAIYIYEDEDNLLHLSFEQVIDTITANDFFENFYQKDTLINDTIPLELFRDFYEVTIDLEAKVSFTEELDIYKIDSIRLDSCVLMLEMHTDSNFMDSVAIEIPSFFDKNGDHVKFEFSAAEYQAKKTVNLDNGTIYLEPSFYTNGLVPLKLHLKFSKKGDINVEYPNIRMFLYDLKINSFYGRFGNRKDTITESAPFIDSMQFIQNDSVFININQPEIYLYFKNGFNFPFDFQNLNIQAGSPRHKQNVEGLPQSIYVSAGSNGMLGYGEEKLSASTNIEEVIGSFPDSIYFYGETLMNPGNKEEANSITNADSMFLGMKGDLPLNLKISEVIYQRKLDSVNMENILRDFIEAVKFNAEFKNNLPVNISAQLYFLNDDENIITQAFKSPLEIKSGDPENDQHFETELSNEFSGQILDEIRTSQPMIEVKFLTAEGDEKMAQFLSTQNIGFDFYVFGKTRFELSNE